MSLVVQRDVPFGCVWRCDDLNADDLNKVWRATQRIKEKNRAMVVEAIAIGKELLTVQPMLNHGYFLDWLKTEFEFSQMTAYRFMNLAKNISTIPNYLSRPLHILIELTSPSTTPEVLEAVVIADDQKQAEVGLPLTRVEVRTIKSETTAVYHRRETNSENGSIKPDKTKITRRKARPAVQKTLHEQALVIKFQEPIAEWHRSFSDISKKRLLELIASEL